MHNSFYASGFLYHPASQQILLQQQPATPTQPELWSLFEEKSLKDETAEVTFHRVITDCLNLPIRPEDCFPVYDYLHKEHKVPNFIYYAVLEELPDEEILADCQVGLFTFKQLKKLPMKAQTRQDITIGQRVINLAIRELEPVTIPES